MMDKHRTYFERRLIDERVAAAEARDPLVKLAHLGFVQLYEMRLAPSFASNTATDDVGEQAMLTPMPSPSRESLLNLFNKENLASLFNQA